MNKNQSTEVDERIRSLMGKESVFLEESYIDSFKKYCEKKYKMSTEDFLKQFKKNDYEGDVEQKLWAQYALM